jgi:hypothetical protein
MNSTLQRLVQFELGPLLSGVIFTLIVVLLALVARRLVRSLRARRRAARALRGERRAAALLTKLGYRVRDAQLSIAYHPRLGGRPFPVALRADYLVTRRGKRYVAEVKTGERAPSLAHAPTRRQLLEYSVAFAVDGVLLVDVEAGLVQDVLFPSGPSSRRLPGAVRALALLGLGALGALAGLHIALRAGLVANVGDLVSAGRQQGHAIERALWSDDVR